MCTCVRGWVAARAGGGGSRQATEREEEEEEDHRREGEKPERAGGILQINTIAR